MPFDFSWPVAIAMFATTTVAGRAGAAIAREAAERGLAPKADDRADPALTLACAHGPSRFEEGGRDRVR